MTANDLVPRPRGVPSKQQRPLVPKPPIGHVLGERTVASMSVDADGAQGNLREWLFTACRTLAIDSRRRASVAEWHADRRDDERAARDRLFTTALQQLGTTERRLVVYRLRYGYSFPELANQLQLSTPETTRAFTRAFARFKTVVVKTLTMDAAVEDASAYPHRSSRADRGAF